MSRTVNGSTAQAGKLSMAQANTFKAEGRNGARKSGKFMVQSFKKQSHFQV
jgi:hypothetical protein